MDNQDLIVIRRFASEVEARIVQSLLGSAQIECFITNEYTSWVMPSSAFSYGLCVKAEDVQRAIEIIDSQPAEN